VATKKDASTLRTQYRVADFVDWKKGDALVLNPNFQRRPVWKKGAKSYLIDTILRGLPMPIIFLRDLPTDLETLKAKRDVVDGQQRIRTVLSFVDQSLLRRKEDNFDPARDIFTIEPTHNEDLGGKSFVHLSPQDKQKILDYQFSVHVFPSETDDREILQIFARMNSTGVNLNSQELRNAEFFGPFKTAAYQLATEQLNRWRDWHVFTPDQIARMKEVELASEFMLLILGGILDKDNTTISEFYKRYNGESSFTDRTELSNRFRATFDTLDTLFAKDSPIAKLFSSRTLFYALFVIVYGLQFELRSPRPEHKHAPLTRMKAKPIKSGLADQLNDAGDRMANRKTLSPRVLKALRGATTDASERKVIIGFLAGKDYDPCRRPLS